MSLRVGQRVVKLPPESAGVPVITHPGCQQLVVGNVYTIREIDTRALDQGYHQVATIRLEGVVNRSDHTTVGPWELGYDIRVFRPAVERKTDISIFTKMLTPAPKKRAAVLSDSE